MIVITEKPLRSIEVSGWYVDEYTDKSDKRIFKLVGIISPKGRGRVVSRESSVVKDIYLDEETITIYRSENYNNVSSCKRLMDLMASRGSTVFSVYSFFDWLKSQNNKQVHTEEEVKPNAD